MPLVLFSPTLPARMALAVPAATLKPLVLVKTPVLPVMAPLVSVTSLQRVAVAAEPAACRR